MVSSFGQPEFTVTVIAMWCHMVWNPASHLTEITRENSRSLPMKWRATLQEGKHPRRKQQGLSLELATTCLRRKHLSRGRAQSIACHPSLRNRRTHWLTEVPTTYLPGHTSVSFLSTGSQLASERQSSLWSEPKSSVSLPSDSFKHVWRKGKNVNIIFIITNICFLCVRHCSKCITCVNFFNSSWQSYDVCRYHPHFTNKETKPQRKLRADK